MSVPVCMSCHLKQVRINELEDELVGLKKKLRYQDRTAKEGPFKSSTPSSKLPVKANSLAERQAKTGGGKAGHEGHGRSSLTAEAADRDEVVSVEPLCPHCRGATESKGSKDRTVIDYDRGRVSNRLYHLESRRCPRCRKVYTARPLGVFARSRYGNGLLAQVAVEHYVHGRTLGQLEQQLGVGYGALVQAMHQLAQRLKGVSERLIEDYRHCAVKHADETGWRNDGQNGYAWGFFTDRISVFRLRKTRSSAVPKEVFGEMPLPGVLVVDRYAAYNKAPCAIQYCYAHLLRDVQDLEKDFPDNEEIRAFVETLAPLLAAAMGLRGLEKTRRSYKKQAARLRAKIRQAIDAEAHHPAIQKIQAIFRENDKRLYHWAEDRHVPADNNRAERELRPLVIARKISFGSQSDRGAHTRETLMTVLRTLKKRTPDVLDAFKTALDQLAADGDQDPYDLIFTPDTS